MRALISLGNSGKKSEVSVMSIIKKFITPCAFFFATLLSAPSVFAEDIAVYLVEAEPGAGANILLVIDNSGGTNRSFPGDTYSDGAKTSDEIVYALKLVLDNVAGTARLGVASQHAGGTDGGKIDYAVSLITESGSPAIRSVVSGSSAEAAQPMVAGVWGAMDVVDDTIALPKAATATDRTQLGLIFKEVGLPRYAKITSATLKMTSPFTGTRNNIRLRMGHEVSAAPLDFSDVNDISGRILGTSSSADASLVDGIFEADVTATLQAAVNEGVWCGRNDLSLAILESDLPGGVDPELYTYRAQTVDAFGAITVLGGTELTVEWEPTDDSQVAAAGVTAKSCMGGVIFTPNAAGDDAHEWVGSTVAKSGVDASSAEVVLDTITTGPNKGDYYGALRFGDIPFASGAQIESAELSATVNTASAGGSLQITSMLGDVPAFAAVGDITGVSRGSETLPVPVSAGTRFTVDVTDMVRESMNDAGWVANGGLGIFLDRAAGTAAIAVHAVDGGAGSAAKLEMKVTADRPGDFVSSITRRDEIAATIESASGNSGGGKRKPGSAYVEAARYMLGLAPAYDGGVGDEGAFLNPSRAEYESPNEKFFANGECGGNHIILVTHAEPSGDVLPAAAASLLGSACAETETTFTGADGLGKTASDYWTCAADVAKYLSDGVNNGISVPVTTHSVVFAPSQDDTYDGMEYVAQSGGGAYRESSDALELAKAILEVVDSVTITDAALAAPGVAVNQLNRFKHLDQLYYGVFRPAVETRWQGNLKRYRLAPKQTTVAGETVTTQEIVDQDDNLAVDPVTGFFEEEARSFWNVGVDGVDVTKGGALEKLAARKLYVADSEPAPSNPARTSVVTGNTTDVILEATDFTAYSDAEIANYGYAGGEQTDFADDMLSMLYSFGDPLHSEPRLVNFGFDSDKTAEEAAADPDLQHNMVFFATNDGMIHAIDAEDGVENWAFMPKDEAVKMKSRIANADIVDGKRTTYGIDGGMAFWRRGDGSGGVDHVLLYAGQRRGGNNYYGLDVTDAYDGTAPGLMWVIRGGQTSGFAKLAQTWSTPVFGAVMVDGVKTPVLIFGGGFDPSVHDAENTFDAAGDSVGNALYIVNAYSGALIWSASDDLLDGEKVSNSDMKWSVPSSPSVVDLDFDGLVDHIYVSDLGGQIFRVDINNNNTTADDLAYRVKTFAKLGISEGLASQNVLNNRKFFAAPVVGSNDLGTGYVLQIAIGSGNRDFPLNEDTDDRLFVLNDEEVRSARQAVIPGGDQMATITTSDLDDVTNESDSAGFDPAVSDGWYINLTDNGEKSVSAGAIVDGIVYLTSFLPDIAADNCVQVIGGSRLYTLDIINGEGANGTRFIDLVLPGLPPQAQVIVGQGENGDSELSVLVGTSVSAGGTASIGKLKRTRWYEKSTQAEADAVITEAQTQ